MIIALLEAARQLSTEILFLLVDYSFAQLVVTLVFGLDLMIVLLTILMQKFLAKHLTIRPMGRALGYKLYYTKAELHRIHSIFRRGLEIERAEQASGQHASDKPQRDPT